MNDNMREALGELLRSAVTAGDLPGVVAVVVDRENVLYSGAAGVMDAGGAEAMRPDAIFQIASMPVWRANRDRTCTSHGSEAPEVRNRPVSRRDGREHRYLEDYYRWDCPRLNSRESR